jgi:hypothetical protein
MEARDHGAIFIVNSFFGLDKPCLVPPYIKLIGSVNLPKKIDLEKTDETLFNWVEKKIRFENKDIVYISMGSVLTIN